MTCTRAVWLRWLCVAALLAAVVAATAHAAPLPRQILFRGINTTVPFEDDEGNIQHVAPASFRTPSLWDIDGAVLSVSSAIYYTGNDESFMESASRLSIDGGLTWTTQIAVKNKRAHPKYSRVMDPTVVVKGTKAYVLAPSWNESTTNWAQQPNGDDWDALLVVGELRREEKNGTLTAWMDWGKPVSVKSVLPETLAGVRTTQFGGGVGNGLLMKNGTIVFPVQVANVEHLVSATIMYSADDGETWRFATGTTPFGCTENNVVEWGGKLIANLRRDDGFRMVFETTNMGASWTETPLSRVWGSAPNRDGPGSQGAFTTVNINGKEGILHTAPQNLKGFYSRDRLMLWLTNGDRVSLIGQISDGETATGYSALALLDGVLHIVYEVAAPIMIDGNRSVFLQPLPEMMRQVEAVLEQWDAQDRLLASVGVPTEGLVGMLSGDADDGVWRDLYGCVDASTTGARKVADGLRFTGGRFGGAQWPVALQGQYQRYIFTRVRFTLAASVTVDEMTARNWNSPLGAALEASGEAKVLGLRYAIDGLWNPVYGYIYDRLMGSVKEGREYHVALVFEDGVGRIYVDGKALEGAPQRLRYVGSALPNIEHLYIGGYMNGELDRDCRSTVRNVMLYNRAMSDEEIEALYMAHGKIRHAATVQ